MIRTTLLFLSILLLLSGCSEKQNDDISITDSAHNARNSLDVHGLYTGTLPCASCPGIETTVVLSEGNTYSKTVTYLGKSEPNQFTSSGTYTWNEAGNTITLSGEEAPNQYFVGENMLIQLDVEGKHIKGELAGNYRMYKE